jgi:hypothetical protein
MKTMNCLVLLLSVATAAHADVVLLKNAKNPTASLGKSELKLIYIGRQHAWAGGLEVELFLNAPGSPELAWLADQVAGTGEDILLSKIKQEVFKGSMKKPASVASASDCIAALKKSPGGLCAVDAAAATSLPPEVTVLHYAP